MIHFNKFGKETLIYGFGGILSKSIGFILIPVYTRIFTPSDYGTLEMMAVIISFISAILTMGLDSAQSFFFFEQKKIWHSKTKKSYNYNFTMAHLLGCNRNYYSKYVITIVKHLFL